MCSLGHNLRPLLQFAPSNTLCSPAPQVAPAPQRRSAHPLQKQLPFSRGPRHFPFWLVAPSPVTLRLGHAVAYAKSNALPPRLVNRSFLKSLWGYPYNGNGGASPPSRLRTRELHWGGADDLADVRLVADVKLHLTLELEGAVDGGAGADRHDGHAFVAEMEPAGVGLVHQDAAVHARVARDVHVAVYGFDAAADVRAIHADVAVDVADVAGDLRAGRERQRAVDRFDALGHLSAFTQLDGTVYRVGRFGSGMLAQRDRAIHRGGVLDLGVVRQPDRTIHGAGILGCLAGFDVDRAVDLVHAAVVAGDAGGSEDQQRQQHKQESRLHVSPRVVTVRVGCWAPTNGLAIAGSHAVNMAFCQGCQPCLPSS